MLGFVVLVFIGDDEAREFLDELPVHVCGRIGVKSGLDEQCRRLEQALELVSGLLGNTLHGDGVEGGADALPLLGREGLLTLGGRLGLSHGHGFYDRCRLRRRGTYGIRLVGRLLRGGSGIVASCRGLGRRLRFRRRGVDGVDCGGKRGLGALHVQRLLNRDAGKWCLIAGLCLPCRFDGLLVLLVRLEFLLVVSLRLGRGRSDGNRVEDDVLLAQRALAHIVLAAHEVIDHVLGALGVELRQVAGD